MPVKVVLAVVGGALGGILLSALSRKAGST